MTTPVIAQTDSTSTSVAMRFLTIPEVKAMYNVDSIQIVRNPKTQKLFAVVGNTNMKCEQALDGSQPIRLMFEDNSSPLEGCIVNVKSDNTIITL